MPCSRTASAPGPMVPARARVGQPRECARWATPTAVLPKALCSSRAPSPVRQRSAPFRRSREVHRLDDEVDPFFQPAGGECDQAAAQAARGAGAGDVGDEDAQVARDDRREVREVGVQRRDHRRRRTLLGTVDGRCAAGAAERIRYIAGHRDLDAPEFRVTPGGIDARQAVQGAAAGIKVAVVGVEQTIAQGLAQPGPAIVGRATADAHDHATCSGGDRRQE